MNWNNYNQNIYTKNTNDHAWKDLVKTTHLFTLQKSLK